MSIGGILYLRTTSAIVTQNFDRKDHSECKTVQGLSGRRVWDSLVPSAPTLNLELQAIDFVGQASGLLENSGFLCGKIFSHVIPRHFRFHSAYPWGIRVAQLELAYHCNH